MELGSAKLKVEVDASGARSGVEEARRAFDILKRQGIDAVSGVSSAFGRLKDSIFSIKGAIAGLGIGLLAKSFIDAGRETENYMIRLRVLLGSVSEGNRLFKEMNDFAARTPFEFKEIMGAATQLSGVLKGGVDEIKGYMPLIADLAAASGLGIQETTGQVVRMLSAGASAADRFRETGINAMLGFQTGVQYSAEQTRQMLIKAWEEPASKFRDAAKLLVNTWDGAVSNLEDAWFQFQQRVMVDGGVLNYMQAIVKVLVEDFDSGFGEASGAAERFSTFLIGSLEVVASAVGSVIQFTKGLGISLEIVKTSASGVGLVWSAVKKEVAEAYSYIARMETQSARQTYETVTGSFFATDNEKALAKERYAEALERERDAALAAAGANDEYLKSLSGNQETLDELFASISKFSDEADFSEFLTRVKAKFDEIQAGAEGATGANADFVSGLLGFKGPAGDAANGVERLTRAQREAKKAEDEFQRGLQGVLTTYDKIYAVERRRDEALKLLEEGVKRNIVSGGQYKLILAAINQEYEDGVQDANKYTKSLENIKGQYLTGYSALKQRNDALKQANELMTAGQLQGHEYQIILANINKEYTESVTKAQNANQATDQYAKTLENAARGIQSAFTDFFYDIFDKGVKSFGDLKDKIIDTFKRMLAEMATLAIAKPIIMPIMQFAGGLMGMGGSANYGQMLSGFFGGGGGQGGNNIVGTFLNGASSGGGSAGGGFDWSSMASWANFGRQAYQSGGQMLFGTGFGRGFESAPGFVGPPASSAGAGYTPGIGAYAAGAAGAYYGFTNRGASNGSGGSIAGAAGYGALGLAGAGAIGGAMAGTGAIAGASSALALGTSMSWVPVVGWIMAILAIVDIASGGRLFGTRYRAESATATIGVSSEGAFAETSLREVRNRSLFRGREWRDRSLTPSTEALDAAEQLYSSLERVMTDSARRMKGTAPEMIDAALRTVQEFDKKGKVRATKYFVDILGRSWEEASGELAAKRITAEAIIATIDGVMGTTVSRVVSNFVGDLGNQLNGTGPRGEGDFELFGNEFNPQDPIGTYSATTTIMGEASAIAERWRGSAEDLLAGAQALLQMAADMRHGFNLLGDGTLTNIVDFAEAMVRGDETLAQAYQRLSMSTMFYQEMLENLGLTTTRTGETFVMFAQDLVDAAGGIQRATQLYSSFLNSYFTDAERLDFQIAGARRSATSEVADLGAAGEGLTFENFRERFLAVFDSLSPEELVDWYEAGDALSNLNTLLGRIAAGGDSATHALEALAEYGNVFQKFEENTRLAGRTHTEIMRESLDSMLEAAEAYDGTADSQRNLFTALQSRYNMELAYLHMIREAQQQINETIDQSIERIQLSQMNEEEKYEYFRAQANTLAASLEGMSDPQQIRDTINQINSLQQQAWGILTEDQRTSLAGEFVDFLEGIRGIANERLEDAQDEVQTQNEAIGIAIGEALDRFTEETSSNNSQMAAAAQALEATVQANAVVQQQIANQQSEAASTMLSAANLFAQTQVRVVLVNQQSEVGYG